MTVGFDICNAILNAGYSRVSSGRNIRCLKHQTGYPTGRTTDFGGYFDMLLANIAIQFHATSGVTDNLQCDDIVLFIVLSISTRTRDGFQI